jgi:hypothetical protein
MLFRNKKVALIGPGYPWHLPTDCEFDNICFAGNFYRIAHLFEKSKQEVDVLYLGPHATRWLFRSGFQEKRLIISDPSFNIDIPAWANLQYHSYDFDEMCDEVGCNLNTGVAAMIDILNQSPKSLYLTGFTFYHGSNVYIPGYALPHEEALIKSTRGNLAGHNRDIQLGYFKEKIAPRVKMDRKMQLLLLS